MKLKDHLSNFAYYCSDTKKIRVVIKGKSYFVDVDEILYSRKEEAKEYLNMKVSLYYIGNGCLTFVLN